MARILFLIGIILVVGCSGPSSNAPHLDGYEVGNGGVIVVCEKSSGLPAIDLLDFYRAKYKLTQDYKFDFGTNSKTVDQKLAFALTRLRRLDQTRTDFYQREVSRFSERAKFVDEVSLPDTRDYGDLPEIKGCHLEQLIIQNKPLLNGEVQFLINDKLWKQLDPDRQTAMIVHEIVYEDAIARGQKTSVNVQLLTALISSPILDTYDQLSYNQMMIRMGMASVHDQSPVWDRNPLAADGVYCTGLPFALDLSLYASHPAKDLLSYLPVSLPSWLSVNSGGVLTGLPADGTSSPTSAFIRATNGSAYSDVEVRLETMNCAKDPMKMNWRAGILQHGNLPLVSPRTYEKLSGAGWLDFNEQSGDLSGTAPATAVGQNEFLFRAVANSFSELNIRLVISVLPPRTAPIQEGAFYESWTGGLRLDH